MMSSDPRVPPIHAHPHQAHSTHSVVHGHGGHTQGSTAVAGGNQGSKTNGDGSTTQPPPMQKPRAPKAYTDAQMAFLKSHLQEFERRSAGPVRGDAKKYALEQARDFVVRFGLPPEYHALEEGEPRFKEQIYNWFKNTIGRKRRQAEGKPRSVKSANSASGSKAKASDRSTTNSTCMPAAGSTSTLSPTLQWNNLPGSVPQQHSAQAQPQPQLSPSQSTHSTSLASFAGHNHGQHLAESSSSSPALGAIQQPQAISLGPLHYGLHTPQQTPQHVHSNTPPVPTQASSSHSTQHHQSTHSTHSTQSHSSHSSHQSQHEQHHTIQALPGPTPMRVNQGQQLPQHTQVNQETLRDAFLSSSVEVPTLANMIQIYVSSCPPSHTPLTPVVEVLFSASVTAGPNGYASSMTSRGLEDNNGYISLKSPNTHALVQSYNSRESQNGYSRDPTPVVQRFFDASRYWGNSIVHCGVTGSDAAARALMGLIKKWSVWQQPSSLPSSTSAGLNSANSSSLGVGLGLQTTGGGSLQGGLGGMSFGVGKMASPGPVHAGIPSNSSTLSEDMQRIAAERQRRKDHIQWARIHAAALEVGLVGSVPVQMQGGDLTQQYGKYVAERAFSEMVARDAVWEDDEAEWVAGLFVLRGLIRSAVRKPFGGGMDHGQREEYRGMLKGYESRWRDIKDEVRQSLATDVLFTAKEELDPAS